VTPLGWLKLVMQGGIVSSMSFLRYSCSKNLVPTIYDTLFLKRLLKWNFSLLLTEYINSFQINDVHNIISYIFILHSARFERVVFLFSFIDFRWWEITFWQLKCTTWHSNGGKTLREDKLWFKYGVFVAS